MTDTEKNSKTGKPKRPLFLGFLCVIGFTYTSLFSLLFLLGMLYSTGISGILNEYLQLYDLSRLNFFLFSIAGFIIFFSAFIGILLMWKVQKLGFYIYTISAITFLILELAIAGFYLPDILVHALLILLFLIAFPFGKKRRARLTEKKLINQ